ncbi:hypothetical protein RDI58_021464 [Solanum bulbocastanum]|uniref:F-box domain-containing protein n=1 Tax=Solanum bulbocastanum TaxID=147425 RepID=A0AAN8T2J6_SOLBU
MYATIKNNNICRGKLMDVDNHQVSYLLHGPNHCLRTEQAHFPEEIIVDILKRLPVRSLLRFKCVSKFWMTLISEPYFKMKHQSHVMNDLNSKKFLVSQWRVGEENKFNLYSSLLSSVQPAVEDIEKLDSPSNRKPSTCMLHLFLRWVGSSLNC